MNYKCFDTISPQSETTRDRPKRSPLQPRVRNFINLGSRTVNLRRPERARNTGSTGQTILSLWDQLSHIFTVMSEHRPRPPARDRLLRSPLPPVDTLQLIHLAAHRPHAPGPVLLTRALPTRTSRPRECVGNRVCVRGKEGTRLHPSRTLIYNLQPASAPAFPSRSRSATAITPATKRLSI